MYEEKGHGGRGRVGEKLRKEREREKRRPRCEDNYPILTEREGKGRGDIMNIMIVMVGPGEVRRTRTRMLTVLPWFALIPRCPIPGRGRPGIEMFLGNYA